MSPTAVQTPEPPPADPPLQLVFSGECLDGHDPQVVRRAVASALKLDERRAARLFSGRRVVLRRHLDAVAAHRYIARFALMGAVLRAEPQPPRAPRPGAVASTPVAIPSAPTADASTPMAPAPMAPALAPPAPVPAGPAYALPTWLRWAGGGVLFTALTLALGLVLLRGLDALWPGTHRPDAASVVSAEANKGLLPPAAPAAADAPPQTAPAAAAAPPPIVDDAVPPDMTPAAVREYKLRYRFAPNHKAFAISGAGAHAWHGGAGSEDEARERALAGCMRALGPSDDGCRVVNADGQWQE